MTELFSLGSEVKTHSLTTVEYNDLSGVVTGHAVEKHDGITRIPVCLHLQNKNTSTDTVESKNMLLQPKNLTLTKSVSVSHPQNATPPQDVEMKECRCMFCGEGLLLESEEAAIAHMEVCPCLQEQLNDTEHQFTLPQSMK